MIYPDMKVIHVVRNGIDVSSSLQSREQSRGGKFTNHVFSCRSLSLEGGFDVWAEYVSQSRKVLETVPDDNKLEIVYEELLTDTSEQFLKLENFLRVPMEKIREVIIALTRSIIPSNAYKFKLNERLFDFYLTRQHHPLMGVYGYS
jgi:hypothetical protein